MDILGSILKTMGAPPPSSEREKEMRIKARKQKELMVQKQKDDLIKFRTYVEELLTGFVKDEKRNSLEFQPMEREYRSIIYDASEIAGQMGMSFGMDGIDRYVVVYKKSFSPSEDEITARRNGEPWNSETATKYENIRKSVSASQTKDETDERVDAKPQFNYQDKYSHLIGTESALAAAKKTESNSSYGCVPSKNKRDVRSIEETLEDIRKRKKQKLEDKNE